MSHIPGPEAKHVRQFKEQAPQLVVPSLLGAYDVEMHSVQVVVVQLAHALPHPGAPLGSGGWVIVTVVPPPTEPVVPPETTAPVVAAVTALTAGPVVPPVTPVTAGPVVPPVITEIKAPVVPPVTAEAAVTEDDTGGTVAFEPQSMDAVRLKPVMQVSHFPAPFTAQTKQFGAHGAQDPSPVLVGPSLIFLQKVQRVTFWHRSHPVSREQSWHPFWSVLSPKKSGLRH